MIPSKRIQFIMKLQFIISNDTPYAENKMDHSHWNGKVNKVLRFVLKVINYSIQCQTNANANFGVGEGGGGTLLPLSHSILT